jgi:hypothetical protein
VPAVLNTLASSPQPAMRPTLRDAFPEMHKGILK